MGLGINTNISSMHAQRSFETNRASEEKASMRLSSGTRIVRAGDDAAGLSVSSQMEARNRSTQVAVRNIQDGISFVQVAEGALGEITNTLVRFRELAITASSDTVGDSERGMVNREIQQLSSEIDRIANSAEYNGTKLLGGGGSWPVVEIQTGIDGNAGNRVGLDRRGFNVTLEHLGLYGLNYSTKEGARDALGRIDSALSTVSAKRANLGSVQQGLQTAFNNAQQSYENHEAARSRIKDADIALESSEMTKSKILSDSAQSVVAQANQNPQLALKLLTG